MDIEQYFNTTIKPNPDNPDRPYDGEWGNGEQLLRHLTEDWDDCDVTLWHSRVKSYPIFEWLCTDSWVGYHMISLDNELVCLSSCQCRKCDTEFSFISNEAMDALRAFASECVAPEDDELRYNEVDPVAFADAYPEYNQVGFWGQLLNHHKLYLLQDGEYHRVLSYKVRSHSDHGYNQGADLVMAHGDDLHDVSILDIRIK